MNIAKNRTESSIYKYVAQNTQKSVQKAKVAACRAERSEKISQYGTRNYLDSLLGIFRECNPTPTKEYWMEVQQ